jgi:hypothetical protein
MQTEPVQPQAVVVSRRPPLTEQDRPSGRLLSSAPHKRLSTRRRHLVNNIIYIVGLIVVVLAILAFLGLR